MTPPKFLTLFVVVVGLAMFGCGGSGGGGDDASEFCEDFCDRLVECDVLPDDDDCNEFCEDIDDEEDEVSNDCEDAIADLFDCIADASCDEFGGIDPEEIEDSLLDLIDSCEGDAEDVVDECEDDIDFDEDDFDDDFIPGIPDDIPGGPF